MFSACVCAYNADACVQCVCVCARHSTQPTTTRALTTWTDHCSAGTDKIEGEDKIEDEVAAEAAGADAGAAAAEAEAEVMGEGTAAVDTHHIWWRSVARCMRRWRCSTECVAGIEVK